MLFPQRSHDARGYGASPRERAVSFVAALLIGLLQTFAVGLDVSVAPMLPYVLMVLVLIFRPRGLAGVRGD